MRNGLCGKWLQKKSILLRPGYGGQVLLCLATVDRSAFGEASAVVPPLAGLWRDKTAGRESRGQKSLSRRDASNRQGLVRVVRGFCGQYHIKTRAGWGGVTAGAEIRGSASLPRRLPGGLFKNAHRVLLADSRYLGHSASNGDEFRRDFLVFLRGLPPNVLFGNLQPQLDGLPDVAQRFFARPALAPAAGKGRAANRKTFI